MSFMQNMQQPGQQKKKPNVPEGREFDEPMEQLTQRMPGMAEDASLEDKVGPEKAAEMKASMQRISEMFGQSSKAINSDEERATWEQEPQMPQMPPQQGAEMEDIKRLLLERMSREG